MADLIIIATCWHGELLHAKKVILGGEWGNVFVIGTKEGYNNLSLEKETGVKAEQIKFVEINPNEILRDMRDKIIRQLRGKITGLEVGLNIISGTGKEHMAVISALLRIGVGFRLIALTPEGVEEV